MVALPTIEESKENWDDLSEADRLLVSLVEEGRAEFLARSLKSPDQLPDIEADSFTLAWDVEGAGFKRETVISLGDLCIWREPSGYENFDRFIEVSAILKKKYGRRLTDLIPTQDSEYSLYGDRLHSLRLVADARKKLSVGKRPKRRS